jgi:uncharacterized protein (DUF1697 family)
MSTTQQPIAVFLRGINVNGVRIAMADLQACVGAAGYRDVTTILATGNVVCTPTTDQSDAAHGELLEAVLSTRFGYTASIHLRRAADIAALCTAAGSLTVAPTAQCYAVICRDEAIVDELAAGYASDRARCAVGRPERADTRSPVREAHTGEQTLRPIGHESDHRYDEENVTKDARF